MPSPTLLVQTSAGPIQGFEDTHPLRNTSSAALQSGTEAPIYKWLGIPYAKAGRFERPTSPDPWTQPIECFEFRTKFPQQPDGITEPFYQARLGDYRRDFVAQSEASHTIDVYTPEGTKAGDALPCLVWIHGGALITGSTSRVNYDPSHWIRDQAKLGRKFVFAAVNYRLNVFGFLSSKDLQEVDKDGLSGNYGVYDCVKGLEWVQENIGAFGGDKDNVTCFGESAGSIMVSTLLCSGRRLFQKAIIQSGAAPTLPTRPVDTASPTYAAILAAIGADKLPTAAERVEALKKAPMEQILAAHTASETFASVGFSIEEGPNATWDRKVVDKLRDGQWDPWVERVILGTNEDEGTMFTAGMKMNTPAAFDAYVANRLPRYKAQINKKYLKGAPHPEEVSFVEAPASRLLHDQLFAQPTYDQAKAMASQPNAKSGKPCTVYLYRCRAEIDSVTRGPFKLGSAHTIALPFIFNTKPCWDEGSHEEASTAVFGENWTRFVIDGKPVEAWEPFDSKKPSWFVFEDGGKTKTESLEGFTDDFIDFDAPVDLTVQAE
ncbi:BZ3500_MvSof-1268-A1-R1_Chr5-3g08265 [Microbotryum saponariae]|uniref:BZ3500_MvSof-1268-A1-R1_Chr5-3g08265 protein n=1 Tax=Microbotryum saponariae TaxID=289078 RepID=A0A2X0KH86_9BASI|nr:BZ3500_MvSof-1268-A1-R1_Chr5-3g08265 [Microbotryum saponariae]SDA08373.1 BZ3501_MvSof-1269-A2-R1_Chr5-3g07993 [Microbotryum saponariae]